MLILFQHLLTIEEWVLSVWRNLIVITCVGLSVGLLVSSCDDKVTQCQRLIEVVNAGNSLIDQEKGKQVITSFQLSKDLQVITKSLAKLNLSDPKLQEFKGDFVQVFESLAQGIGKASQALGAAKNAAASTTGRKQLEMAKVNIDTSLTAAENAGKKSDSLAKELNDYCKQY